jgi:2-iminobutanoate/2-iminopropanoate deaminase
MKRFVIAVSVILTVSSYLLASDSDRKFVKYSGSNNAPLSRAVLVGDTLYTAGHIGTDPTTGKPGATPEVEAREVMDSLKNTVENAGLDMEDVVSIQIFCTNLEYVDTFNTVYRTYFHRDYPARALIGANKLLLNARFEVQAIAVKKHARSGANKK